MFGFIFRTVGWKYFAAGAATAVVGSVIARPAMVTTFKAGIGLKSAVTGAYAAASSACQKASDEVGNIYAEAAKVRESKDPLASLVAEIKQLRDDVATLKAPVADLKAKS